ncbi:MAG TPA: efflux RND transporter periplasmic adaptor subunit [Planctomycetaceae bacterium]|nr:efflux RND transporter periplasmic adaptor subunit [Planctomycetaceae bacterium]HIQ19949.1 efflux RND transporter periplasmic adaptor subunit [Planctomycetota bacterium]
MMGRFVSGGMTILKVVLPLVTVALSVGVARWLIATKPEVPERGEEGRVPGVVAARVVERPVYVAVRSQGSVVPCTETTLVARVSGRIVSVAEAFDESGFFRRGEALVQIERRDYELHLRRLEAALEAAEAGWSEARSYLQRLQQLRQIKGTVTEVELDRAEAAERVAGARVAELRAQRDEARHALTDTTVVAPFNGCIRQKLADVGQFVTVGTPLATCFSTDAVEVRLPVDDEELALVGLDLGESVPEERGPPVRLEAPFADRLCRWQGRIVRAEGFIDPRTRMVHLVARVRDPYGNAAAAGGQPLAVGMFVEASIRCGPLERAVVLPESCLDRGDTIWVIDGQGKLRRRVVRVRWRQEDWVVVEGELREGQRVCATRLEQMLDGMRVDVLEEVQPAVDEGSGVIDLAAGCRLLSRPVGRASGEE